MTSFLCASKRVGEACRVPVVSVIVPAHNAADFIEETLKSVLWQTYRPIELVVVDDSSTDDTSSVVERWVAQNVGDIGHEFKVKQLACRGGNSAVGRNLGVANATGEYFQFLDHDDLLHPEKIAIQVEVAVLTGADLVVARNRGFRDVSEIGALIQSNSLTVLPLHRPEPYYSQMRWSHLAWLVRRDLMMRVGAWNEALGMSDYEMDTRLKLCAGHVCYVNRLLSFNWTGTPGSQLKSGARKQCRWRHEVCSEISDQLCRHRVFAWNEHAYLLQYSLRTAVYSMRDGNPIQFLACCALACRITGRLLALKLVGLIPRVLVRG